MAEATKKDTVSTPKVDTAGRLAVWEDVDKITLLAIDCSDSLIFLSKIKRLRSEFHNYDSSSKDLSMEEAEIAAATAAFQKFKSEVAKAIFEGEMTYKKYFEALELMEDMVNTEVLSGVEVDECLRANIVAVVFPDQDVLLFSEFFELAGKWLKENNIPKYDRK